MRNRTPSQEVRSHNLGRGRVPSFHKYVNLGRLLSVDVVQDGLKGGRSEPYVHRKEEPNVRRAIRSQEVDGP